MRTFDVADATGDGWSDHEITAPLLNSAGEAKRAGLLKTGAGTMLLGAANTYSGPTTINDGALAVTGTFGDTAITVNSPATLISVRDYYRPWLLMASAQGLGEFASQLRISAPALVFLSLTYRVIPGGVHVTRHGFPGTAGESSFTEPISESKGMKEAYLITRKTHGFFAKIGYFSPIRALQKRPQKTRNELI